MTNGRPDERNGTKNGIRGGGRRLRDLFTRFSQLAATSLGTPWVFALAIAIVVVWAALGPIYHFSDTWQLVINTGTTIITFLMVFLIQNTQNRDARAIHLKLDEIIRSLGRARNKLVDLENCSEEELEQLEKEFQKLRAKAEVRKGNVPWRGEARRASTASAPSASTPGDSGEPR